MRRLSGFAVVALLLLGTAAPAHADATVFVGTNMTPEIRSARGLSVGIGLLIIGFEFEYASTPSDDRASAPALKTGSGNVLLQTPMAIHGFQPYFTAGMGGYRETLGAHVDTSFAANTGGGVKVSIIGPIRLRVDYRVLKLGSGALYTPAHRIYAGLNLKF